VSEALLLLVRDGLVLALLVAAPMLVATVAASVLATLLRALTQLDDPSVSLVAKAGAVAASLALFGPHLVRELLRFTARLFAVLGNFGHSA
jgi:flagellar biosynthesis protein FliQ